MEVATGVKPDISALLTYHWWQPVYYLEDEASFPSESKEKRGRWAGVAENVGDTLTYIIVSDDIIIRIHSIPSIIEITIRLMLRFHWLFF